MVGRAMCGRLTAQDASAMLAAKVLSDSSRVPFGKPVSCGMLMDEYISYALAAKSVWARLLAGPDPRIEYVRVVKSLVRSAGGGVVLDVYVLLQLVLTCRGTGPIAVYALLGARMLDATYTFVGTELDGSSRAKASACVAENSLQDRIRIEPPPQDAILPKEIIERCALVVDPG